MNLRLLYFLLLITSFICKAQIVKVEGVAVNQNNQPIEFLSLSINQGKAGATTDEKGKFSFTINAQNRVSIYAKRIGYKDTTYYFDFTNNERFDIKLVVKQSQNVLDTVEVENLTYDQGVTLLDIESRSINKIPGGLGEFNKILTTQLGVSSNNELSSNYAVRGGNFDENLIYVEGFQIYRPFLIRQGQQEGLSFVNSDMVSDVKFSAGGWDAKYGDKLS